MSRKMKMPNRAYTLLLFNTVLYSVKDISYDIKHKIMKLRFNSFSNVLWEFKEYVKFDFISQSTLYMQNTHPHFLSRFSLKYNELP